MTDQTTEAPTIEAAVSDAPAPGRVPFADMKRIIRARVLSAELRLALCDQTQWWVPKAGWTKLTETSIVGVSTRNVHPSGVEYGPTTTGLFVSLDLDALDEENGEKIAVSEMDVSYRRTVIQFLWRQTGRIADAMSWALTIRDDPFGGDGPGWREQDDWFELWHARIKDEAVRRAWFDELPLIAAMRHSIIEEIDDRVPGPVLLDRPGD